MARMKTAWALTIVAGALCATGVAQAQRGPTPAARMDVLKVHGQVYLVAGPASNALVQVGDQGVLVVDTMRDQDADALLVEVRKLAGNKPIRYVLNTHAH